MKQNSFDEIKQMNDKLDKLNKLCVDFNTHLKRFLVLERCTISVQINDLKYKSDEEIDMIYNKLNNDLEIAKQKRKGILKLFQ